MPERGKKWRVASDEQEFKTPEERVQQEKEQKRFNTEDTENTESTERERIGEREEVEWFRVQEFNRKRTEKN